MGGLPCELKVREFDGAFLFQSPFGYRPFDCDLNPIKSGFLKRGAGQEVFYSELPKVDKIKVGDRDVPIGGGEDKAAFRSEANVVFLDSLLYFTPPHREFGHFITEGLSKYWCFFDERLSVLKNKSLFNGFENKIKSRSFVRAMRGLAGIEDNFNKRGVCLKEEGQVFFAKKLLIPDSAVDLAGMYNYKIKLVWDAVKHRAMMDGGGRSEKVYLSRTKVPNRKCKDEFFIESFFESKGFLVVHPQELTVQEQISLLSQCKVVAGLAGSALHLSQFMNEGATLIALCPSNHIISDLVRVSEINSVEVHYIIFDSCSRLGDLGVFSESFTKSDFKSVLSCIF